MPADIPGPRPAPYLLAGRGLRGVRPAEMSDQQICERIAHLEGSETPDVNFMSAADADAYYAKIDALVDELMARGLA